MKTSSHYVIDCRKWRDKINSNTYHSVEVYRNGVSLVSVGMKYGYGSSYVCTALEALYQIGEIDRLNLTAFISEVEKTGGSIIMFENHVKKSELFKTSENLKMVNLCEECDIETACDKIDDCYRPLIIHEDENAVIYHKYDRVYYIAVKNCDKPAPRQIRFDRLKTWSHCGIDIYYALIGRYVARVDGDILPFYIFDSEV